jgi:hypothetical protein
MELALPSKLQKALEREAATAQRTLHAHIVRRLEQTTPPVEQLRPRVVIEGLPKLVALLARIPAVRVFASDSTPDSFWWVKLDIAISHRPAWHVVQELGFVLNYLSLQEKLPTVFMPVSPPPYLNGGPEDFLSWVIESRAPCVDPAWIAATIEGRLPRPLEDEGQWSDE